MLFTTGYRCPLHSASERTLLMHEPITTLDPRRSIPNAVATQPARLLFEHAASTNVLPPRVYQHAVVVF
jgi:hypothetical protein